MNCAKRNPVFGTKVSWTCRLIVAISVLVSGCAARVTSRAQSAVNVTMNAADAVASACTGTPNEGAAKAAAAACNQAARNLSRAAANYEQSVEDAREATERRVAAQEYVSDLQNQITSLRQNRRELYVRDSTAPAGTEYRVYNVENGYINRGIIGPTHARIKSHVARAPETMETLVNEVDNSPYATDALKNDVHDAAARHAKALADAEQALSEAENATGSEYEDAVLRALRAEWELDVAEQDARIAAMSVRLRQATEYARAAAEAESEAIAARSKALADLQTAMDAAQSAAANADSLVQLCGKTPLAIQIPGFSQIFTDIHGSP